MVTFKEPRVEVAAYKLVLEAVVAKKLVVVALVAVALPPIVSVPTIVVEAFWKMFSPDQLLLEVVPKAKDRVSPVRTTG